MVESHFRYDTNDYHRDFNFVDNYKAQMAIGLALEQGISYDEASEYIDAKFSSGEVKVEDRTITTTVRNRHGDREVKEMPTLDYFKKVEKGELGMAPTLTTFNNPNQKLSLVAESIKVDMGARKIEKGLAIDAKGKGNKTAFTLHNGMQNAIKTLINSWSGATQDKHNPFYCRSTHPVLTSCCRITTATCTAAAERFVAGKRYYYDVDIVIEDFIFTLQVANNLVIREFIDRNGIYRPTVDDVMEMVLESSKYYWKDEASMERIRNLVTNMTSYERATILYTYDFHHFSKHNDEYARRFLTEAIQTELDLDVSEMPTDAEELAEYLKGYLNGDQTILLGNLLTPYLTGKGSLKDVLEDGTDTELMLRAKRIAKNIVQTMDKYAGYIRSFMRCNSHPLHLGKQNYAIRKTVPLGDTDSSLIAILKTSEWYYGHCDFTKEQEPIQDIMTYLVTQIFEHLLMMFTSQMGVTPENRNLLVMKNEYKFNSLMLTPVAKTYHANTVAQEGILMGSPEYELKGARFHASKANVKLIREFKEMLEDNLQKLKRGEQLSREALIDKIMELEEDILQSVDRKGNPYFLNNKVKPAKEYKQPNISNYVHYELWNDLFGYFDKAPEPTYMAAKVPVQLSNKSEINAWLDTLSESQKNKFNAWREKFNKTGSAFSLTNILVPLEILNEKGLPEEIKPIVNYRRLIADILDPYYLYLSVMGIHCNYTKNQKFLTDIIEDH